ncbi:MAG: hypothetical protein HY673_07955 [Chloroflexi bacterium]|nr:hypothetical protein [Chloroflexota bacterium]
MKPAILVRWIIEGLLILAVGWGLVGCDRGPGPPGATVAPSSPPAAAALPAVSPTPVAVHSPSPSPAPTVAPTAAPRPVSPAPPAAATPIATPTPQLTEAPPPSPTPSPPPPQATPVPTSSPVPVTIPAPRAADVRVAGNRTAPDFPNKITFVIEGASALAVKSIFLEYGTNKRSLSSEATRVEPQYGRETRINTSYSWEMKKTYSIPPGARIWWQWHITDAAGGTYTTPRQSVYWEDSRFSWQVWASAGMDMYYLNQPATLMKDLTAGLEANLARLKLRLDIPTERKPRVYVYNDSEQVKSAFLFPQQWTGAVAFPDHNIVLAAVNANNLDWAKTSLAHEITHLRVGEAVFGPFGHLPTWLNEGLAEYVEGEMPSYLREILNQAIKDGKLISVRSLGGNFPADSSQAYLAYAESNSLVTYLVDNYGWEKMQQLLEVFTDGSTNDNALKKVYGFDIDGLEKQWKTRLGAP